MARYTGSGNDQNQDALGAFGLSLIPGLGSNQGANFTNVQHSPRMTTRTMVNNLTVGGNQRTSRSATPSPSRNMQYVGTNEINFGDGVTLTGNNIVAGASIVDMRKGGKSPKKEQCDDYNFPDEGYNVPAPNLTINVGDNVTFNAKNNLIFGASYVRIDDEIDDEEIKKRFRDLMGDNWDGKLNAGSDESAESAERTLKEAVRKEPLSILKVCSSICLILWDSGQTVGTGFLARVKGFEDIVLLTAGHNFKPGTTFDDHTLYFKAMDGDENGKGVLKIPFSAIQSRKFSFVSTCKGKKLITNNRGDYELQKNIKGDPVKIVNPELDYCLISLPGWEKFIKEHKLDTLEVKEQELNADRLCYVGHPYMGFCLGKYNHINAADSDNNEEHYAELKEIDGKEGIYYEWSNGKGEKWKLYNCGEQDKLLVDEECQHFESGYTEAKFIKIKQGKQILVALLGPDEQPFLPQASIDNKDTKMSKALRFSYGSKTQKTKKSEDTENEKIKIHYTLDTKGGASGSPVLGDDYTVSAIHTFWKEKDKASGGIKISAVMEDLDKVKEKYPDFFKHKEKDDFTVEAEGCHWCSGPKPIEIQKDQNRIDELEKAKDKGSCVLLHLKPEEITNLLNIDKIDQILK